MTLTTEEHYTRELRIANSLKHTFPLTHKQVADLIGVTRAHYCRVLNRGCWYEKALYERVMDIDIDWYMDAYPEVLTSNLNRMRVIVETFPKAEKFMKMYS